MSAPGPAFHELARERLLPVALETMHVGHLIDRALMPQVAIAGRDVDRRRPDRHPGMDGGEPGLHGSHATPDADRGRWRRRHHQGAPARRRLPPSVHGRGLEADRRAARRVLAAPLRRADGRGAARREARDRHVPHDRGPDLRRHRLRDEPARADPSAAPAAAHAGRSQAALPLDDRDRSRERAGAGGGPDARGRRARRSRASRTSASPSARPTA